MVWADGAGVAVRVLGQADAIRMLYGIRGVASEEDVDRALEGHGLTIHERHPFRGRVKGLLIEDHVFIRRGLQSGERAAVKAHELGHYVLHEGNGLYLQVTQRFVGQRRERQAQLFAGALILGSPSAASRHIRARIFEAQENGVPIEFLCSYASAIIAEFGIRLSV